MLLVSDLFYDPNQGDIIVFHQSDNPRTDLNKPLVKRVIATEGQYVYIEYRELTDENRKRYWKMFVYVSNDDEYTEDELFDDAFIDYTALSNVGVLNYSNKNYSSGKLSGSYMDGKFTYTAQIPEGCIFCVGDNRYNSTDSRVDVGFVDVRCVLGKVLFRITPPGSVY